MLLKVTKKVLITLSVIIAFFFCAQSYAKYYIKQNYSATVDSISFNFFTIQLNNIIINKPNIKGKINKATIDIYKNVLLDGGDLNLTFNDSPTKNTSNKNIIANNINAHIIYKDLIIDVKNLSYINKNISADQVNVSGLFYNAKIKATLYKTEYINHNLSVDNGTITVDYNSFNSGTISFYKFFSNKKEAKIENLTKNNIQLDNITLTLNNSILSTSIDHIIVNHPKLYTEQLTFNYIEFSTDLNNILSEFELYIEGSRLVVNPEGSQVYGSEPCNNWLNFLPKELITKEISQLSFQGTFGFNIKLYPPSVKIQNNCIIKGNKPEFITNLSKPFTYTVYHPNHTPYQRISGPGSAEWVGLSEVSPNMSTALTTTEDPGFFKHRGIIPQAIENSLKDNIKLGKFFRGGSTISMQLAKNLFLNRNRNLGRKIQEAILTTALESSLSKEQILELYVNVVEYGPDLYGIGPASTKLLDKYPGDLSLSEALYLALRLPAPNKAATYQQARGMIKRLLNNLSNAGRISDDEVDMENYYLEDGK